MKPDLSTVVGENDAGVTQQSSHSLRTLHLRDAARRIKEKAPGKSKGFEIGYLLHGLQGGKIRAGFFFPDEPRTWVSVSAQFWAAEDRNTFRVIHSNSNSPGAFKVGLARCAEEYVRAKQVLLNANKQSSDPAWSSDQIVKILQKTNKKYEVLLEEDGDWRRFLDDLITEAVASSTASLNRTGSGRRELTSWKIVNRVAGAYIAARNIRRDDGNKLADIAMEVLKQAYALKEGNEKFPTQETVEKEIVDILFQIERFNLQK